MNVITWQLIDQNTPWHTIRGMTMPGDCVNASMLYTVRERPQMIAKGVKKPLSPSCMTNTIYECKPGLTVLSIYVSKKTKIKPSMGTVWWWSASLISCKWLANNVLRNIFRNFSGLYLQRQSNYLLEGVKPLLKVPLLSMLNWAIFKIPFLKSLLKWTLTFFYDRGDPLKTLS